MYYRTPKRAISWIHSLRSPMPGSIQVSVMDFKDLPSSSKIVKISLGKLEHEAREKGTFSFPLPNLRDNLIITVLDSEGNQVSHSGVRTISIIEKGTWDDLFPIEGGGLIHMKLQFILSDEERNRIRLRREYAMKKKQDEILSSRLRNAESAKSLASSLGRHEVSDVLRTTSSQDFQRSGFNGDAAKASLLTPLDDTSVKAAESSDGIKEVSFQRQSFTNATDRMEETSFSTMTEEMDQKALIEDTGSQDSQTDLAKNKAATPKVSDNMVEKLHEQNLDDNIPSDVKRKSEESTSTPLLQETEVNSNKDNEIRLQKAMVEDTETHVLTDLVKNNNAAKSKPSDNLAEKLDTQNLGEKSPSYVKEASRESVSAHSSQETKVNTTKNNEIRLQQANKPQRLQDASSPDVGSSRSVIAAEKIKLFSPKLAGEPDKQGSPEKIPRNIKKMISVFESSISQDRVPMKPVSTKSYRVGRLLKDPAVKDFYERSESSMGSDDNLVEPSETNMQSKGTIASAGDKLISADPKGKEKLPKDSTTSTKELPESSEEGVNFNEEVALTETNTKEIPKSPEEGIKNDKKFAMIETYIKKLPKSHEEDATVSGRTHESGVKDAIHAEGDRAMSLLADCKLVDKGHQENTVASIPESIVKSEVHYGSDGIVKQGEVMVDMPGNSSPKSSDEEDSTPSLGQAIKIALVVGFGVLVLLFRQREPGKGRKKENNVALKNQVFMNKRGSIGEHPRKIHVMKLS